MTKLVSKICKKGRGLILSDTDKDKVWNFYGDSNVFEFEEELLQQQDRKLKKHYLKSDAKAFVNKFKRMLRSK